MTPTTSSSSPIGFGEAATLALRLADAENALRTLTSGQVDAIVDASGQTYLLRPAQEQLRESEQWLRAVIDSAADVITVVNRGGMIVSQSEAVNRLLGYDSMDLVGTSIFALIHEEDLARLHGAFFNVIEGIEEHATAQYRHRARDDSWRLIEATVRLLRGVSPASVVFCLRPATIPFRPRTDPARRDAAPGEDSLGKDRFLAMLAHELRTPLAPVRLGLDELQEDERFADARPTLTMMGRNIALQMRLIEELTDFATVGQHKVQLRLEPIDAHEAIRFVQEICQSELTAAQIEVLLYFRAEESIVQADSVRLQQVMWNLIKNAIKFSTPGSSISIATVNDAPGRLTIEFADHGIGIEAALLPRIFDSFSQGNYQIFGGLGLGMFIAKGLAEAQGGTLTVSSQGRGKGAAFYLRLNTVPYPEVPPASVLLEVPGAFQS